MAIAVAQANVYGKRSLQNVGGISQRMAAAQDVAEAGQCGAFAIPCASGLEQAGSLAKMLCGVF
ncbi:MAG: hypothetical protein JO063_04100 [Pseudonocardiales bacterium]|nr:hypothetical protein [Pseudonocardiales bacterium]MBV9029127.1 hypothetical protein [Pseudonocardiales bacterium]MBW0009294.1 hypothetical protein [Pseudonocardiales bacterium]